MTNTNKPVEGQITQEEIAAATAAPSQDPELDEIAPAQIDAPPEEEPEVTFTQVQEKGKKLSPEKTRTVVESILFVADKPLSVDQLFETTGIERQRIVEALQKLQGLRREGISGVVLHEVGGGWQFRTDPGAAEYVKRFLKVKPQRLTRSAVETLSIIAYRQPVTRPEIEDIRGVDTGAVVKALLERRMIKILGRKEEVGRPILYGTTREFLEFFALKDLSSLPTLREFQELSQEHQAIVEKETPVEVKPGADGTVDALADPTFEARLEAERDASEAALAELEAAIGGADNVTKTVQKTLDPAPPPAEPVPAAEPAPTTDTPLQQP